MTEQTLDQLILAAFSSAVEAGKEEDEIKMEMIQAGATFKNVTRLFNQFMVDGGYAVSKEEKDQILADLITETVSTEEGFNAAVLAVMDKLEVTEKSAAGSVRAYAKKAEFECFKKAKATGAGRQGFASGFYDFLIANPTCTVEEATAFINGEGDHEDTTENVKRHASHYLAIHALVNKVAGVETPVEAE